MANFNIVIKAENLYSYILDATEKSPKKIRFDIVPEIRKQGLRIIEDIIRANSLAIFGEEASEKSKADRLAYQEDCLATIRVLNAFAEMAKKNSYITNKQLENLTKITQELYDSVNKWIESDKIRK